MLTKKGRSEFFDIVEISLLKQFFKACFVRKRNA